ncbi:hypothetical protein EN788_62610 [Mesorhizobium sp. M2D.F.Ca.ET.145.01.1.1]|nr:hypothetical protein EN788_62610 [Mesorhizobium sp. M2D.F.Ca.ET.145.01.1.1]
MRGGRGFRTPAKEPEVHRTLGTTRGQRKRMVRAASAAAETDRQKRVCAKMAERSGIPFEQLKYQFGSL